MAKELSIYRIKMYSPAVSTETVSQELSRQNLGDIVRPSSTTVWVGGENTWERPTGSPVEYSHILEGVDRNGRVRTEFEPIRVPVPESYEGTELDWLKERVSPEHSGPPPLWYDFPISDSASVGNPCSENTNILSEVSKHPGYNAKYNCGNQ
jgi:hypothetical protein